MGEGDVQPLLSIGLGGSRAFPFGSAEEYSRGVEFEVGS